LVSPYRFFPQSTGVAFRAYAMGHGVHGLGVLAVLAVVASAENVRVPHPEDFVNVLAGTVGGQRDGMHHSSGGGGLFGGDIVIISDLLILL
jgi:hypothetical protein